MSGTLAETPVEILLDDSEVGIVGMVGEGLWLGYVMKLYDQERENPGFSRMFA